MATTTNPQQAYGQSYAETAAERYERYFVPSIGGPLAADLVEAAALRPGERVLDVACGTGIVTRLAAQRVASAGTVAGLDVTAGMLDVARSIAPPAGTSIRWYEASAEAMPLPDESYDVVLCQLGLQFIPDKPAALREMRRVLVPNGRLLVSVPGPTPFFDVLEEGIANHVGTAAAEFVRLVFSLHEPSALERLLRGAGFRDVAVQPVTKTLRLPPPRDFLWQYIDVTPIADAVAQLDEGRRASMERDVVARWQPWVTDGQTVQQQAMVVATARR
jgi:ubiquinone/menaquinone biosynthesis C-methylase UbiE